MEFSENELASMICDNDEDVNEALYKKYSYDKTNKFSTVSSYMILEGNLNSKELGAFSINLVRLPYDIEKEVKLLDKPFSKYLVMSILFFKKILFFR